MQWYLSCLSGNENLQGLGIVARDRHADASGLLVHRTHASGADGIEGVYQAGTGKVSLIN